MVAKSSSIDLWEHVKFRTICPGIEDTHAVPIYFDEKGDPSPLLKGEASMVDDSPVAVAKKVEADTFDRSDTWEKM